MPTYTLISLFVFSTALIYLFVVEIEGCVRRIDAKLDVIASVAAISGAIFFLADLQSVRMLNKNSERLNQEVSISKSIAETERSLTMSFLAADARLERYLSACEVISAREDPFVISPEVISEQDLSDVLEAQGFRSEDCDKYADFQILSRVLAANPIMIVGLEVVQPDMQMTIDSDVFLRVEETIAFVSEHDFPSLRTVWGSGVFERWRKDWEGSKPMVVPNFSQEVLDEALSRLTDNTGIAGKVVPRYMSLTRSTRTFEAAVEKYKRELAEINSLPEVEEISPLPIEWVYLIIFAVALETAKACRIVARDASGL